MPVRIKCRPHAINSQLVKVRIIKAPLVDTRELYRVVFARARALVL